MVTILMEDIRSGVTDHQLAEVRVPLFEKDDCLWANAEEVCEQLQASASRIYGQFEREIFRKRVSRSYVSRSCRPRESIHSPRKISTIFPTGHRG